MKMQEIGVIRIFRRKVAEQLCEILGKDMEAIFPHIDKKLGKTEISVIIPKMKLSETNVEDIMERYECDDYISRVYRKGTHVNFEINYEKWGSILIPEILKTGITYGMNKSQSEEVVVVEYSSPNIAKLFHVGHLRSTILGNFVKNVFEANGAKTISINYLGDWGKQYGLLMVGYKKYGNEEELEKNAIRHLYDVYVKICHDSYMDETVHDAARQYLTSMDTEATALWKRFKEMSIKEYEKTYKRLNIKFDVYDGESMVQQETINEVMEKLHEKNLSKRDNGALVVSLEEYKLGKAIVEKSDGTTIYLARDMGAAVERYEKYKYTKMFYVVASAQDAHFQQLFKIMSLAGYEMISEKCKHVNFGMVKSMSTRRGNAVFLNDLLDTARDKMLEKMQSNKEKFNKIDDSEKVADQLGRSAIYIQDMSARRLKDYTFNWRAMVSHTGDTGPYLQYTHVRLCSIVRESGINPETLNPDCINYSLLREPEVQEILSVVAEYPLIIEKMVETLEPSTVVCYAFELSHSVSRAWQSIWVMNQEKDVMEARAALYGIAKITLGNTLRLLGLEPLEIM